MAEQEQRQRDRYITLLGDPIHTGALKSILVSNDTKATGIATAFAAAVHSGFGTDPTGAAISAGVSNITGQLISRYFLERIALSNIKANLDAPIPMADSDMLKELCVDKSPEGNASVQSITKYGHAAKKIRLTYAVLLGTYGTLDTVKIAGAHLNGIDYGVNIANDHIGGLSTYTRLYNGYQRFNKVVNGEWAIVTTPEPEQVTSHNMAYTPT